MALGIHLKHVPNCGCLCLDNLELHSVRIPDASIAEYAPTSVQGFQRTTLHTTVGLQAQLTGIHAINQAMHAKEDLGLGALRVNSLRDSNQADTSERQALVQI
ncbi:MAG: hypothetical protein WBL63_02080 [Candidatus Acidiferrum sp.]